MTIQHIVETIGYIEIFSGFCICSAEYMNKLKEEAVDEDEIKNIDFSESDFWVCEQDSFIKRFNGCDTIEEAILEIIGIDTCRKFTGDY